MAIELKDAFDADVHIGDTIVWVGAHGRLKRGPVTKVIFTQFRRTVLAKPKQGITQWESPYQRPVHRFIRVNHG